MRPEGLVAFSDMSGLLLLILVGVVLWLFWASLGAIFDAITDYHWKARAASDQARRPRPIGKER